MNKKVVACVAGASGGHIIPGIVTMLAWEKKGYDVLFFSTKAELDQSILELYGASFTYCSLPILKVPGKKLWRYPSFFLQFLRAFFRSLQVLKSKRPEKVVSMGGIISLPVCLAAWLLGIEIELFELNAVPGKAVRWLAPLATNISVCFKQAAKSFDYKKVQVLPYPVRFFNEHKLSLKKAKAHLGLPDKKVILILGGSQGSQSINRLIQKFFTDHSKQASQIFIIHQTGASSLDQMSSKDFYGQLYADLGYEATVFDYLHDLHYYYCAADIVIARAGAGTLFELEFFAKKAIIVPLEFSAEGHQRYNALAMVKRRMDLFSFVRQACAEKDPKYLYAEILKLLEAPK